MTAQNPQLPPNTENFTPQSGRNMIAPSAPNISVESAFSIQQNLSRNANMYHPGQPLATSADFHQPQYLSECKFGYQACFCKRGTTCHGKMSEPPFQ